MVTWKGAFDARIVRGYRPVEDRPRARAGRGTLRTMELPVLGRAHGVVLPVRLDPTGRRGPTARQAAGPRWRRSSHGGYVLASVPVTPAQRVAEAGVLLPGGGAAVTGWAALSWRGARWHAGTRADGSSRPVDVSASRRVIRPQPLLRLREERNDVHGFELVDGLWVVPAVVAVAFEMRYAASTAAAVEALDMAFAADLLTPEEIAAWVTEHPSYVGIQRARDALPLADENVWSPQETHLRLAWEAETGVRPLVNRPVFDVHGRHLGTVDVLDPAAGVFGEYDGDGHLDRHQRRADLQRRERLVSHGLEEVVVVGGDLGRGELRTRLRSAYARARRVPAADRAWTLRPPSWWRTTLTVAERRLLEPWERAVWLRSTG